MRGSVVKRGNTWSYVVDVGRDPASGRRRQRWKGGFPTKREAERALAGALTGGVADAGSLTVGVYFDQWLAGHAPSLEPSTAKSYREVVRWYVKPRLGQVKLVDLNALLCDDRMRPPTKILTVPLGGFVARYPAAKCRGFRSFGRRYTRGHAPPNFFEDGQMTCMRRLLVIVFSVGVFAAGVVPSAFALRSSAGRFASASNAAAVVPGRTSGGYWLVASDGGIFSFGDARFAGSTHA